MALPWSRHYTYVAGQVVGGSPFMITQHLAAAFFAKNRRKQQSLQLPIFGQRTSAWTHAVGEAYVKATNPGVVHIWPIHLPVGSNIATAYLGYNKAGATGIRFSLYRQSHATGVAVEVVFVNLTGVAGTWFYDPLTVGHVVQDGSSYWLRALSGQTNDLAQRCELLYTRP